MIFMTGQKTIFQKAESSVVFFFSETSHRDMESNEDMEKATPKSSGELLVNWRARSVKNDVLCCIFRFSRSRNAGNS